MGRACKLMTDALDTMLAEGKDGERRERQSPGTGHSATITLECSFKERGLPCRHA